MCRDGKFLLFLPIMKSHFLYNCLQGMVNYIYVREIAIWEVV